MTEAEHAKLEAARVAKPSERLQALCVNVYREDLEKHAARMKADPERTRNLLPTAPGDGGRDREQLDEPAARA